jgi:hypothetical protein
MQNLYYVIHADCSKAICFDCNTPSSDRCINEVRNSSISHVKVALELANGKLEGKLPFTMNEVVFLESGASTTMTTRPSSILAGTIVTNDSKDTIIVVLKQSNPSASQLQWPCVCQGYTLLRNANRRRHPHRQLPHSCRVRFTESTMVRVCSMYQEKWRH